LFASYEEARHDVEQAALDELAAQDRGLLEELLRRFADAYAAAKEAESALDFEDLQLNARNLLRDHPAIRDRESWRFRSVLVDELLVTDKATYKDTGTHWRAAEAKHVATRVKDLVDTGEATPGEIVLLFAAGTDAKLYEEALRELGLPTFRATGRDYYHQQQV